MPMTVPFFGISMPAPVAPNPTSKYDAPLTITLVIICLPSKPGIGHRQTQDLNVIDDVRDFENLNHNMAERSIRPRVVRGD